MINGVLFIMLGLVAALAALAWFRGGSELLGQGLGRGVDMMIRFALLIAASFLAAGLIEALVPKDWIRTQLGAGAGMRALVLATAGGMITPSGPFVAIPLAVTLLRAGAGTGVVLAYVSAWGLVSLHRLIAWEIPLLGARLSLLRFVLCLGVPALIGLLIQWIDRAPQR